MSDAIVTAIQVLDIHYGLHHCHGHSGQIKSQNNMLRGQNKPPGVLRHYIFITSRVTQKPETASILILLNEPDLFRQDLRVAFPCPGFCLVNFWTTDTFGGVNGTFCHPPGFLVLLSQEEDAIDVHEIWGTT